MKILFNILFISILFFSCREEGEVEQNQFPQTKFSIDEINLSGDRRLNSIVSVSWYGTDPDGYVKGFELSFDRSNWTFTTAQDSTFTFSISSGSDTVDVDLYIRAVDNEGAKDPTPSYLKIPIKNTPPSVSFDDKLIIPDSTFLVATTEWKAEDLDGIETITNVYIKINNGNWTEISKNQNVISLVPQNPEATDTIQSLLYYGSDINPQNQLIDGLVLNDTNKIFIKVLDQAGTESEIDTSNVFYMRSKVEDLLVVGGVQAAHDDYKTILNNASIQYDFLNLTVSNGIYRPFLWNITFRLQLSFYDKLFFYSDETPLLNPYTNTSAIVLESAASSLQFYANSGGKYFISTNFRFDADISGIVDILPIASLSQKNFGSCRLWSDPNRGDSAMIPVDSTFPRLQTQFSALTGVPVFNINESDTEVLYRGQLSDGANTRAWPDTKIIASGRRRNGRLNQVFFSTPLFELNRNPASLVSLFDRIFNVEFN